MAKDTRKKAKQGTGKKRNQGRRVLMISLAVFCVLLVVFIVIAVRALTKTSAHKDQSDSTVNAYDTTPVALQNKVAYYVVGLLGKEETSPTESLMLLCHDKKKKTINILEVPQDTYLGDSEIWVAKKAGAVWGNPAPLDWCEFEGKRLYKAEIEEHKAAGHTVTQKTGSSSYNVIAIFNEQYSLPVDGYFMIPQEAFVKLVDLLDGIDVKLDNAVTLGETTYGKGVRTLDGTAALQYITTRDKGVAGDISRIVKQRRVFLALFQRLCAQTEEQLEDDSLLPLMGGSTPIRTRTSTDDMLAILKEWRKVTLENMTAQLLPGEVSSFNSDSYYSVHRAELITALNNYFNPYDEPITEADVQITELATGEKSNVHLQKLSEIALDQSGVKEEAEEETAS